MSTYNTKGDRPCCIYRKSLEQLRSLPKSEPALQASAVFAVVVVVVVIAAAAVVVVATAAIDVVSR